MPEMKGAARHNAADDTDGIPMVSPVSPDGR
jgi:hypothetical protein